MFKKTKSKQATYIRAFELRNFSVGKREVEVKRSVLFSSAASRHPGSHLEFSIVLYCFLINIDRLAVWRNVVLCGIIKKNVYQGFKHFFFLFFFDIIKAKFRQNHKLITSLSVQKRSLKSAHDCFVSLLLLNYLTCCAIWSHFYNLKSVKKWKASMEECCF